MSAGVEGAEEQVPSAVIEIEVETAMPDKAETIDHGETETVARRRPPRPLFPRRFPFRTAKGFGNWIYAKLTRSPLQYETLYSQLLRFCSRFQIRALVRVGKRIFHDYDRLCFLQGLFIIAVSAQQKTYIRRIFGEEFEKMWEKSPAECN